MATLRLSGREWPLRSTIRWLAYGDGHRHLLYARQHIVLP